MGEAESIYQLEALCTFTRGVTFSKKDQLPDDRGIGILRSHNVVFEDNKVSLHNLMYVKDTVRVKDEQRLKKDDLLISISNSKEQTGKLGISPNDTDLYIGGFMAIIRAEPLINPYFLFLNLSTKRFKSFISGRNQGTTNIWNITFNRIKDFEIPLPPLGEQKRIAALFQSIDAAIEQAEEQEKRFRKLAKKLVDQFIDDDRFGNLLIDENLTEYRWKDCVDKLLRRTDPEADGIERIVAGENLESEDFKIRSWGTVGQDFLGPAFHVRFEPGDILYGSRRTYLRKVSLADFVGVCANTTFVVKAKGDILLQGLLKHIMLSERFTQYSIAKSKGSTNPYINWKDLDDFKFRLPSSEIQQEMVEVLDGCIELAEQHRNQLSTLKKLKQKLLDEILG